MAIETTSSSATKWVTAWLAVLAGLVYAMILVGGATRLTDSGLSITEWEPIRGALPPLGEAAWAGLFEKYKSTAEYRLQNAGMTLAEFQYIFWWEWAHRFFGRVIGLVAIVGYAVFRWRGWLSPALSRRCLLLIALGGLQGAIGWWMVASGIGETSRVDVAPYRLMTHFTLALAIIAIIAWTIFDLTGRRTAAASTPARAAAIGLLALTGLQMAAGALVAGLDAGRTYTDWPLMAGEVFPSGYLASRLGLRSVFEGVAATQFNHRFLAYLLLGGALAAWFAFRREPEQGAFATVAGFVAVQSVWGVLTLMNVAPLHMALLHQALGVVVLLAAVRLVWRVSSPAPSMALG